MDGAAWRSAPALRSRMEWVKNSNQQLVLEYLNRLQNLNQVMLADVQTGVVRTLFEDKDPAWVDYVRSLDWVQNGKGLLWLSERDGWRHAYVISLSDGKTTLITNFPADVISEISADDAGKWFYFIASPDDATRKVSLPVTRRRKRNAPARNSG